MGEKQKPPRRKRKQGNKVDPTKMSVLQGGKQGVPGMPAGMPGAPQQETREQRTMKMLALRNLARKLENKPLYFLPVDTNPLAVMGILQVTPAEEGLNREENIPWSCLETFLPLPAMEVPGRTGMYYLLEVVGRTTDKVTLTISRKDIIDESQIPKPPAEPEAAPESQDAPKKKE